MSLEGLRAPVTLISNSDKQPLGIPEHLLPEAFPPFLVGASVIAVVLNNFCLLVVLHMSNHVCSSSICTPLLHSHWTGFL